MKVLIVTPGWRTHLFMATPLAWALRVCGHEVRVTSPPAGTRAIIQAGLPAVALGPDLDFLEIRRQAMRHEAPDHDQPATDEDLERLIAEDGGGELLAAWQGVAFSATEDLVAFCRQWRPDLVVSDALCAGGLVAAHVIGVPAVRLLSTVDILGSVDGEVLLDLPGYRERFADFGVTAAGDPAHLTINQFPPSALPPPAPGRRDMRHVPYNGPAVMPSWLLEQPARPRVCVTWGTSSAWFAEEDRFRGPAGAPARPEPDRQSGAPVGPDQRPRGGEVPPGVRLVENLALHLVLPSTELLVHQGGGSTMLAAASHGVPQLVIPYLSEQVDVAEAIAVTEAGRALFADDADVPALRHGVAELRNDPSYGEAANRLQEELIALPTPIDTARMLAGLAGAPTH